MKPIFKLTLLDYFKAKMNYWLKSTNQLETLPVAKNI
jgi:hypothetical protein